ncbi:MAG: VWA domain-containing protein [Deltaproteobacteria bacterium]|nr:VWA domain-containing protein [Deltaproteobacteria bacterium]
MARRSALALALVLGALAAPAAAQPGAETLRGPRIDVVFAIDATGSMADEIQQVKQHLWATANGILQGDPQPDVRFGLVVYRDRSDSEHTRVVPLTRDVDAIHRELMNLQATGGGDYPEDVDAALQLAVDEMNWSDTGARLVFLIGDAPPKDYGVDRNGLLERARRAEITFHTVQASGMTPEGGTLFTQIAQLTGGEAEILTYRQMIAHNGRQRLLLRRGEEVFMSRRPLRERERALSFRELRSRNLIQPAPAAVARRAAPARPGRRMTRGRAGGGSPRSAAPAAAAPVEFSDSDIGGIVNREARRAAEAEGVAY